MTHQRIPADQQVDARDRRILDEVVTTEDDLPAEILAEGQRVTVRRLEVALDQALVEALELLCRERRAGAP
jgi:hypothetical protein